MTESKYQIFRSLLLAGLLILIWVAGNLAASPAVYAAPAEEIILDAVQDTYTDLNAETTNFDEGLLTAANSPGPPEEGDVTTKQIFLEFDLSSVNFEIKGAKLSLATLTCGGKVPVDAVDIGVYGVENTETWDETKLAWENQPDLSTAVLATLDAGGTTFNSTQIYTWTDENQGDLSTWLETQRVAITKNATLVLVIENTDDHGLADIFFEDSEGTGAAYGCPDVLGKPSLQVGNLVDEVEIFLPLLMP